MQTHLRQYLFVFVLFTAAVESCPAADNWPQFRGPNCSGVASASRPPWRIGPTNNVLWKVEVPFSPSSPCVWGDRIFLSTFTGGNLETCCYEARNGRRLWSREIHPETLEVFNRTEGSPSASTPATDGRRVVSYFGSFGVICHDFDGKELWRHPLPVAMSGGGFGSGTSPALCGKFVLLNRDQDENSSVVALDAATGKTVWETPRPDAIGSFGTPVLWKNGKVDEVIIPGSIKLKAYELKSGKERWVVEGVVGFACTTPVVGEGMLFFAGWSPGKADSPWPSWEKFLEKNDKNNNGVIELAEFGESDRDFARGMDRDHDGRITKADWDILKEQAARADNVLVAIKPGGTGDITRSHVIWKATRGLPYVSSPIFYDGRLYMMRDGGMLSCFDTKDGKAIYLQERIEAPGSYYASPVVADGKIYFASLTGKLTVIKAGGEKPEVLHQADFGERIFATPAVVKDKLYLRTQTKLYAFAQPPGR